MFFVIVFLFKLPNKKQFGRWTLTLLQLQKPDQGRYSCQVQAADGQNSEIQFDVEIDETKQASKSSSNYLSSIVSNSNVSSPFTSSLSSNSIDWLIKQNQLIASLQLNNTQSKLGQEARLVCRSTQPNPQPHFLVFNIFD